MLGCGFVRDRHFACGGWRLARRVSPTVTMLSNGQEPIIPRRCVLDEMTQTVWIFEGMTDNVYALPVGAISGY